MKIVSRLLPILLVMLFASAAAMGQAQHRRYPVDSLMKVLSRQGDTKRWVQEADAIYKAAHINGQQLSKNAFRIAYLEKRLLDTKPAGDSVLRAAIEIYSPTQLITVVDFTRKGNLQRLMVIDLGKRRVLHRSLVAHGSAKGKNSKEEVPCFFSNRDSSNSSNLGMLLAGVAEQPESICHLCKYFLNKPHPCARLLTGIEKGINDNAVQREIILHTTGSRDFSDSASLSRINTMVQLKNFDTAYRNTGCNCITAPGRASPAYASACGIRENRGYIGRSLGCLALPEEQHMAIMAALKTGSLVFIYSDAITDGGTNYFEESDLVKQLVALSEL
ncbi:MAG: hypothetical protein EOP49_31340 [Sphingobacteriales bacterium]|nr:MAG: hypothetical protein EOP49_31340 [Sphingobacteriales bacterium]